MPRLKQQKPRHIIGALLDVEQQDNCSEHSDDEKVETTEDQNMQLEEECEVISRTSSESSLPPIPPLRKDIDDTGKNTASSNEVMSPNDTNFNAGVNQDQKPTVSKKVVQEHGAITSFNYFKQGLDISSGPKISGDDYSSLIKNMWNNLLKQFMDKMADNETYAKENKTQKIHPDLNNNRMQFDGLENKEQKSTVVKGEHSSDVCEKEHARKSHNEDNYQDKHRGHGARQNPDMLNAWKEYMKYRELCISHWKRQAQIYGQSFPTNTQSQNGNMRSDPHLISSAYGGYGSWTNSFPSYLNPDMISTPNSQQLPYYNNNYAHSSTFHQNIKKHFAPNPTHATQPSQQSPPNNTHGKNNMDISSYVNTTPAYTTEYDINPDFGRNSNGFNERSVMDSNSKIRKPRSRSSAVHSIGDAIVREAKQQLKGVDPENMYIPCPICHKRIKRLYHFQRHMRIHSGEKSHHCPFCPYKSVRKDNLKSHMKTHEKHSISDHKRFRNPNSTESNEVSKGSMYKIEEFDYPNKNRLIHEDNFRKNGLLALPSVLPNALSPMYPMYGTNNTDIRSESNINSPGRLSSSHSKIPSSDYMESLNSSTPSSRENFGSYSEIKMFDRDSPARKRPLSPNLMSPAEKSIKLTDKYDDETVNENNCNNIPMEEDSDDAMDIDDMTGMNNDQPTNVSDTFPDSSINKESHSTTEDTKPIFTSTSIHPVKEKETSCSPDSEQERDAEMPPKASSLDIKCRVCSFIAESMSSLQNHMATHKAGGYYKCSECNYHGKNLSKLVEHNRIHTGERPFQCDQCSYAAKRKDNLAQHKNVKHKIPTLTASKQSNGSHMKMTSPSQALSHGLAMMKESKGFTYPSFPSSLLSLGRNKSPKLEPSDEIKFNFSLSVSAPKYSWKPEHNKPTTIENKNPELKQTKTEKSFSGYENGIYEHSKLSVSPTTMQVPPRTQRPDVNYMGYNHPLPYYYPYIPPQQPVYQMFPYQTNGLEMQSMMGMGYPAHGISQNIRIKEPKHKPMERSEGEQAGGKNDKDIYIIPSPFRVPDGTKIGMT